jgi:cytochrome c oxidase assembly factor CtaG
VLTVGNLVAHLAPPVAPADAWRAWSTDVLAWVVLAGAVAVHTRGWRRAPRQRWRHWAFIGAAVAAGVALLSPLDAISSSLASAHMAQHLLLTLVVAPLLVLAAPAATILRGLPRSWRVELVRLRPARARRLTSLLRTHPVSAATVSTVVLWTWHASNLYELALRNDIVHRLEHLTFLATAWCAWVALVRPGRHRTVGLAPLVLLALSVQGAVLGALMTFAGEPWYPAYGDRSEAWNMTPLEDQQLAGLLMWVPAGAVYLLAALALLITTTMQPAAPAGATSFARVSAPAHLRRAPAPHPSDP